MNTHPIVPHSEWLAARRALLAREKRLTRERDELAAARRALPWERVEKPYSFDTPQGEKTLGQLFDGRSQLLVYHFMFHPDWEAGCKSCSFMADAFDGMEIHLRHRDVTFTAIARAPLPKLETYKRRLGWSFPLISSLRSDFNQDFKVSFEPHVSPTDGIGYNYTGGLPPSPEMPGISVFARDAGGAVFHTYSCYARGLDALNSTYAYLDLVPKGRDEADLPFTMEWVRRHDEY